VYVDVSFCRWKAALATPSGAAKGKVNQANQGKMKIMLSLALSL